jgi:SAM-dependent methyltransferase
MILHRLLWRYLRHGDDPSFYRMQTDDAIRWLTEQGVGERGPGRALDLGCGHGILGAALHALGWEVTFADQDCFLLPEHAEAGRFVRVNLDGEAPTDLGRHDLVLCSNVLEHLSSPRRFLRQAVRWVEPSGCFYLSWTPWGSPWGGHEFSPWHYLGPRWGPALHDALGRRTRFHRPGENLFVTWIGEVLGWLETDGDWELAAMAPRYYTEWERLMRVPLLREVLSWNAALLLRPNSGRVTVPELVETMRPAGGRNP